MATVLALLQEPDPTLDELLPFMAAGTDAELLQRQTELLDLLGAVGRGRAAHWLAEILTASARQPGNVQQRLSDGRVRALALMPAGRRNRLLDTYLDALKLLEPPLRERDLRLTRRSLRLVPRDRQQAIEAYLDR